MKKLFISFCSLALVSCLASSIGCCAVDSSDWLSDAIYDSSIKISSAIANGGSGAVPSLPSYAQYVDTLRQISLYNSTHNPFWEDSSKNSYTGYFYLPNSSTLHTGTISLPSGSGSVIFTSDVVSYFILVEPSPLPSNVSFVPSSSVYNDNYSLGFSVVPFNFAGRKIIAQPSNSDFVRYENSNNNSLYARSSSDIVTYTMFGSLIDCPLKSGKYAVGGGSSYFFPTDFDYSLLDSLSTSQIISDYINPFYLDLYPNISDFLVSPPSDDYYDDNNQPSDLFGWLRVLVLGIRSIGSAISSGFGKILDFLGGLFVPDSSKIQEHLETLQGRFAWSAPLSEFANDLKMEISSASYETPDNIYLDFSDSDNTYLLNIGRVCFVDFSKLEKYRSAWQSVISVIMWVFFLWTTFKKLPSIISGVPSGVETIQNVKGGDK